MSDLAFHPDGGPMILDDLVHHRQPDAGIGSLRLGGEERIENAGQLLRFDTVSSVTHARDHGDARIGQGLGPAQLERVVNDLGKIEGAEVLTRLLL